MTTAVGVCGFGRCGSTMLMAMLDAGGIPPVNGTSRGSYELPQVSDAWDVELDGRSVKLLEAVLHIGVPDHDDWRFIWLDRDPVQQARSQVKLLRALGIHLEPDAQRRFRRSNERQRDPAVGALRKHGKVWEVTFEDAIYNPCLVARDLAGYLTDAFPGFDAAAAAGAVHDRSATCLPDLAFEHGAAQQPATS